MTYPGLGGQQPPPQNASPAGQLTPGVTPGVSGQIIANRLIVTGVNGAVLVYGSSPPSAGGLIDSTSSGGFTDSAGNLLLGGTASYINTGVGAFLANTLNGAQVLWYTAPTEAGPWTQVAAISVGTLGNMSISLNSNLTLGFNAGATVGTVPQSGGSGITTVAGVVAALEAMGLLTP